MIEFLHEFYTQILSVLFMGGVITLAVWLGHKARDFKDKRKADQGDENTQE